MSQALVDGVYAKLIADTEAGSVFALTSGRIYNGEPPQDETLPYITFFTVANDPEGAKFGKDNIDSTVQIDAFADKQAGRKVARTIGDTLFADFHRQGLTIAGHGGAQMDCFDRGTVEEDGDANRVITQWRVSATED